MPGAVVVGAGPGIGRAVARRFAREGLPVALIARTGVTLEAVAALGVRTVSLTADATDETALRAALDKAAAELGPPEVVVYNAAIIRADRPGELSPRGTWTPGRSTSSAHSNASTSASLIG
ncbi:SDR family NAD(P)-dependent oxidoreductase [Actinoallomurus sp. NPDC050550]|uniref:SDR family oxidoreductase n=1 Tax=Actinoallomurus sp. NPDC050550 TaxID=3154937 RepID=UPI0033DDB86A